MRLQRFHASLIPEIPDANRVIVTRRKQVFAARMEYDTAHPIVVAHQREQTQSRAHVPNLEAE